MICKSVRKPVVCALVVVGLSTPVLAIFGIGDLVFDPTNFEEAARQLVQMEQQYEELVRTYDVLHNQYEHLRRMAQRVPVNMMTRYRAAATEWRPSSATNVFGMTGAWVNAVNTGVGVADGYARAIQRLDSYGTAIDEVPADQRDRLKTTYSTVELSDGANQHAIETLGRLRGNAAQVARAIQGLEEDSLSAEPDMNTEIAVLNKINAAHLIAVRSSQDANSILVSLAEGQLIEAKRRRDAETQAINNHIRFMREGKAAMASQAKDASAAMLAWRMP